MGKYSDKFYSNVKKGITKKYVNPTVLKNVENTELLQRVIDAEMARCSRNSYQIMIMVFEESKTLSSIAEQLNINSKIVVGRRNYFIHNVYERLNHSGPIYTFVHKEVTEQQSIPIKELGLNDYTRFHLQRAGYSTIELLEQSSDIDLLGIEGIGEKRYKEIKQTMKEKGYSNYTDLGILLTDKPTIALRFNNSGKLRSMRAVFNLNSGLMQKSDLQLLFEENKDLLLETVLAKIDNSEFKKAGGTEKAWKLNSFNLEHNKSILVIASIVEGQSEDGTEKLSFF